MTHDEMRWHAPRCNAALTMLGLDCILAQDLGYFALDRSAETGNYIAVPWRGGPRVVVSESSILAHRENCGLRHVTRRGLFAVVRDYLLDAGYPASTAP